MIDRRTRVIAAALCVALLLGGCSALLEGEREASREHQPMSPQTSQEAQITVEAQDYASVLDAVTGFIEAGVEHGVIRCSGYEGDLEADLAEACLTASTQTAMGAYCVSFINYSINRLIALYEASVSVLYRHTPEEAASLRRCTTPEELEPIVREALEQRAGGVTVVISDGLGEDALSESVERAYYENPGRILYIPDYSVTLYPQTGPEQVMEVALTYPYATSTVEARRTALMARAGETVRGLEGDTDRDRLMSIGRYFAANVKLDETFDSSDTQARRYNAMTAYGALVQGTAAGEGFAMALKVLCDSANIPCTVVRGRRNNIDHAWDIVELEGVPYHMDLTVFDAEGAVFLTDEQQASRGCWWDQTRYPACPGPSLYGPEYFETDSPDPDTHDRDTPTRPTDDPGAPSQPTDDPGDTPDDPSTDPDTPDTPPENPGGEEQPPTDPPETDPGETDPDNPGGSEDPGPVQPGPSEQEPEPQPQPSEPVM